MTCVMNITFVICIITLISMAFTMIIKVTMLIMLMLVMFITAMIFLKTSYVWVWVGVVVCG